MSRTQLLTLRIELVDSNPLIWRTFQLPDSVMLDEAGQLIQVVMGWEDCHLQAFCSQNPNDFSLDDNAMVSWFDQFSIDELEGEPQEETTLGQALERCGEALYFQYDFGDNWVHRIEVIAAEGLEEPPRRARVLAGAMRAPIEDSGGLTGWYAKLHDAGAFNPTQEQRDMVDWMRWRVGEDGTIDPEAFDPQRVNELLGQRGLQAQWNTAFARWLLARPALRKSYPLMLAARAQILPVAQAQPLPDWFEPQIVNPFRKLIELCGTKGQKLTPAGNLPGAAVEELVGALGWQERVFSAGQRLREGSYLDLTELRETATSTRLVRKYQGRLLVTKLGRELSQDPEKLAYHLIDHLTQGTKNTLDVDQDFANWLCLVVYGSDASPAVRQEKANLMNALGYASGRTRMHLTAEDSVFPSPSARLLGNLAEIGQGIEPDWSDAREASARVQELARLILNTVVR